MIFLRNFEGEDASYLYERGYSGLSKEQIEALICDWSKKEYNGRYFEMLAVVSDGKIVGMVSLYQHSSDVISIGPEIFCGYRRKGFAKKALSLACQIAKEKGFEMVSQQIRIDNAASIALHRSLGFETNGKVFSNAKGNQVAIYLKSLI